MLWLMLTCANVLLRCLYVVRPRRHLILLELRDTSQKVLGMYAHQAWLDPIRDRVVSIYGCFVHY